MKTEVWRGAAIGALIGVVVGALRILAGVPPQSRDEAGMGAAVTAEQYRGWRAYKMSNNLIDLHVVPDIGGRVIQFRLGEKEYLWVNPALAGKVSEPSGLGPKGERMNYGGDKLWPAPQGWETDEQWPGPPDPILDGSPFSVEVLGMHSPRAALRLTSRDDKRSGIRFVRTATIFDGTTRVSFDVTMTNVDSKPRRWGIWCDTQVDAGLPNSVEYNPKLVAWCPLNPKSHFPEGYHVMFGSPDNPTFQRSGTPSMMRMQYRYRVGKVGMDSVAGWAATVDGRTGYVFVQVFKFIPRKEYPDGASVEFWSAGLGRIHAYNRDIDSENNRQDTPYLVECELLSPFANLCPGESYSWHYEWRATNIGGDYPVVDYNDLGVISQPLKVASNKGIVLASGRFGVFQPAVVELVFLDAHGNQIRSSTPRFTASPLAPALVSTELRIPEGAVRASVVVFDLSGQRLGTISSSDLR